MSTVITAFTQIDGVSACTYDKNTGVMTVPHLSADDMTFNNPDPTAGTDDTFIKFQKGGVDNFAIGQNYGRNPCDPTSWDHLDVYGMSGTPGTRLRVNKTTGEVTVFNKFTTGGARQVQSRTITAINSPYIVLSAGDHHIISNAAATSANIQLYLPPGIDKMEYFIHAIGEGITTLYPGCADLLYPALSNVTLHKGETYYTMFNDALSVWVGGLVVHEQNLIESKMITCADSPYIMSAADHHIIANALSGDVQVTLPPGVDKKECFVHATYDGSLSLSGTSVVTVYPYCSDLLYPAQSSYTMLQGQTLHVIFKDDLLCGGGGIWFGGVYEAAIPPA